MEHLEKAADAATLGLADLRQALHESNAVESLVILELIGKLAEVGAGIDRLRNAKEADNA